MIGSIFRSIGALVAGLVVAFILVVGVEFIGNIVHPFPPGADMHDMEVCKAHVAKIPAWFLGVGVVLWGLTTFVSSWLATRLGSGRHWAHGIAIGVILLALALFNMAMLPYPLWFEAANVIVIPLAFILGAKLGGPPSARTSSGPMMGAAPDGVSG